MYCAIEYLNYRNEQYFKVLVCTPDLDYAKKVAFHHAKKLYNRVNSPNNQCKITTIQQEELYLSNKIIIEYKVIEKIINIFYDVIFAVIEVEDMTNAEEVEEIDETLM